MGVTIVVFREELGDWQVGMSIMELDMRMMLVARAWNLKRMNDISGDGRAPEGLSINWVVESTQVASYHWSKGKVWLLGGWWPFSQWPLRSLQKLSKNLIGFSLSLSLTQGLYNREQTRLRLYSNLTGSEITSCMYSTLGLNTLRLSAYV